MVGKKSLMILSHQNRVLHWFLGNHVLENVFPETVAAAGRMNSDILTGV